MALVLRDYQTAGVDLIRQAYRAGKRAPLFVAPTGAGKCLARGTPILMFDGTIRAVEDVRVGDKLMGPDSKPRAVLSLARGTEEMFRVTPTKGDAYTVNRSHILSLRITGNKCATTCAGVRYMPGDIANVSIDEYMAASETFRHCAKGWRTGVEFPARKTPNELTPYILGLWLGDGFSHSSSFANTDQEVIAEINWHALSLGLNMREERVVGKCPLFHITPGFKPESGGRGRRYNAMKRAMHRLGVLGNKHVPDTYKFNSRAVRLDVLAGLMDSDGSLSHGGFDFISKEEQLADDVCFLARSVGLAAYKHPCTKVCGNNGVAGRYFRVSTSGDASIIPCRITRKRAGVRVQKKNVLNVGIKVEPVGVGEYFGFEIDGDRLFLLGDFTVTHNTTIFSFITDGAAKKGRRVWILVHRSELKDQTSRTLRDIGVAHGIISSGESMDQTQVVQVASVQTVVKRLGRVIPPDLIITDEAHHAAAGSYAKIAQAFPKALHLGVSATPQRLDGKGLDGVFDLLIRGPEVADLIARGFLSRPAYFCPPVQFDASNLHMRGGDFDKQELADVIDKPKIVGDAVATYSRICPGAPAIAFCVSVAHSEHVAEAFRAAGYRAANIDGNMSPFQRRDLIASLGDGRLHVLTSCDLIGEGVDVPVVSVAILLRPTQSLGLHIQQIGRCLRPVYAKGMPTGTDAERLAAIAAGPKPRAIVLDHVGNCSTRHGLAEERREWSLEGRAEAKKKKKEGDAGDRVCQCKKCYGVFLPAPQCPHCGEPTATGGGREVEQVEGELVELVTPDIGLSLGVAASGAAFRQCPKCQHVHSERLEACPKCGRDHAAAEGRARRAEQGSAQSFADLIAVGKKRGMRAPHLWAAHVWRARHGRTPTAEERAGGNPALVL